MNKTICEESSASVDVSLIILTLVSVTVICVLIVLLYHHHCKIPTTQPPAPTTPPTPPIMATLSPLSPTAQLSPSVANSVHIQVAPYHKRMRILREPSESYCIDQPIAIL